MNGMYYPNGKYPNDTNNNLNINTAPIGNYANEQSYIENILRLNRGKKIKAYFSFPDSNDWRDKVYEGVLEQAGKDHLIISDPNTGMWELILLIYLNYVEFGEPINYNYPYAN